MAISMAAAGRWAHSGADVLEVCQNGASHDGCAAQAFTQNQYTDTASFALRCQICQIGVVGENEALEHAKSTGHANFSEYNAVSSTNQPSVPPQAGVVSA